MELLDIVDEQDQVVGQASRAEIHAKGLAHRACHMLLFNSAGQLFLQKRSMLKDEAPGLWDSSAAGHVDAGELYIDCAVRELEEELGLKVDASALTELFKLPATPENAMEFATVYSVTSDALLTLDPSEIDAGIWLYPAEVDEWLQRQPETIGGVFRQIWTKSCTRSAAK